MITHRLKELLTRLGPGGTEITLYRLAAELCTSHSTLTRVANDEKRAISTELIDRLLNRYPELEIWDVIEYVPSDNCPKKPNANLGTTRKVSKGYPQKQGVKP